MKPQYQAAKFRCTKLAIHGRAAILQKLSYLRWWFSIQCGQILFSFSHGRLQLR
jgi:hypothetical protein